MKKNNVAIMTWHTYKNYGSILQASAITRTIHNLGYDATMISYLPKGSREDNRMHIVRRCIKKCKQILNPTCFSDKENMLFDAYVAEKIPLTTPCRSYPELYALNDEYDAFVCGSDQIWSPHCYDDKYFLSFVRNPRKMVAYAPSMGATKIVNPIVKEKMAAHIARFQHLAVREQQGADLIHAMTGQTAHVVLDPTLLMDAAEWDAFASVESTQKIRDEEYILCYFLGEADKYMGYVRKLSKKLQIPFYVIPLTRKQKNSKHAVPFSVGPSEFVSLIRCAKYVCTDSFHGMAFSVNYNIPFSVFKRFQDNDPQNQNSRVLNLLKFLKLENRLADYTKKPNIKDVLSCNFSEANISLKEQRADSMVYLESALASATSDDLKETDWLPYKITDMCCGCGACATVCPTQAISISRNAEGFNHYVIDEAKCVRCGKCKSVCPMAKIVAPDMRDSVALYAVKSNSEQVLKKSSSGGIGHELASHILQKGYSVAGCIYDTADNSARHIWIEPEEREKLPLLQGSKYIQSRTVEVMQRIGAMEDGEKVAFFGTPCQVAAVDRLLRKKNMRNSAILVDLICHGVPSYYLWEKYLRDLDKEYGTGRNPKVLFRSQKSAWWQRWISVVGNGCVYEKDERQDDFYAFFRRGLCDMAVCSDCPYRERSAADLRIGDYWGNCRDEDKLGISMVIANTNAGNCLLDILAKQGMCVKRTRSLTEYWTVQFPYNAHRPLIREQLIEELVRDEKTIHDLRKVYCASYDKREAFEKLVGAVKKALKRG